MEVNREYIETEIEALGNIFQSLVKVKERMEGGDSVASIAEFVRLIAQHVEARKLLWVEVLVSQNK